MMQTLIENNYSNDSAKVSYWTNSFEEEIVKEEIIFDYNLSLGIDGNEASDIDFVEITNNPLFLSYKNLTIESTDDKKLNISMLSEQKNNYYIKFSSLSSIGAYSIIDPINLLLSYNKYKDTSYDITIALEKGPTEDIKDFLTYLIIDNKITFQVTNSWTYPFQATVILYLRESNDGGETWKIVDFITLDLECPDYTTFDYNYLIQEPPYINDYDGKISIEENPLDETYIATIPYNVGSLDQTFDILINYAKETTKRWLGHNIEEITEIEEIQYLCYGSEDDPSQPYIPEEGTSYSRRFFTCTKCDSASYAKAENNNYSVKITIIKKEANE